MLSNEQFVEMWRQHGGAEAIAKATKLSLRRIYEKRRKAERELGITLNALIMKGDAAKAAKEKLGPSPYKWRLADRIDDGVVIVFSDAHYWPGEITTAHRALIKLCKELRPRIVVCNGDAFDGARISRFPRINWEHKPSVKQELDTVDERLTEIKDASPKNCRFYWPLGNHDSRMEIRIANAVPELEGIKGVHLKDHFDPIWKPCLSLWINDHTVVKHRFKGGIHAAHNNTVWSGKTILTGHLHSLKVTPFDDYNGTRFGVDTGTLADTFSQQFEDYMEDSARNWRSGFAVLTFWKGRLLWPELVHVLGEGQAQFRGQVFDV